MCRYCADTAGHEISFPRRSFLKFAGGVSAGLGFSRVVFAKEAKVHRSLHPGDAHRGNRDGNPRLPDCLNLQPGSPLDL